MESSAVANLSDEQLRVLDNMLVEWGTPLDQLAADSQLTIIAVRRIVRIFEMVGWVQFGYWMNDEGLLAGRGYCLTTRGGREQERQRQLYTRPLTSYRL